MSESCNESLVPNEKVSTQDMFDEELRRILDE